MNKFLGCLLFLSISTVFAPEALALSDASKATILVVDEEGAPIKGAIVGMGFEKNTGWGTDATGKRGVTGVDGRFVAEGNCNGHITYGADKEGYYNSHYEYDFKDKGPLGWKPWNPELKVILRKIQNPVPMYARKVKIDLPVLGEEVGYDLIAYDFTPPYGRGTQADLVFKADKKVENKKKYDSNLVISFSNKYDGIKLIKEDLQYGSELKLPRIAPFEGYFAKWSLSKSRYPNEGVKVNFAQDDNYVFRVRSEEKDGKFERAMYGKILGPISFGNITRRDTATIAFKYYLNPDYTRNLEFDPERNLFGPLPPLEQVGIQ
jgi:hypothetical protein